MEPRNNYIAVAGNIGSGKSSLVEFLCKHFKCKPFYEPFADNPYLADFYKDMKRYAFHSQMYFLSEKFKMLKKINKAKGVVVQDRTVFEDAEIFAKNLHRQDLISKRDFAIYQNFYDSILHAISPPRLLIYLKCSVPAIMKRIAKRGRKMENEIPEDYIRSLAKLYDGWVKRYKQSPVITIPTDKVDYLEDFIHKQELLEKIGKYV
ncbi:MAG: deoxynucleoside kinase [Deltaproteobacteria bacterium]|nr:deoxynucleoside kinase [Deltaproteobacteria bacterium]